MRGTACVGGLIHLVTDVVLLKNPCQAVTGGLSTLMTSKASLRVKRWSGVTQHVEVDVNVVSSACS